MTVGEICTRTVIIAPRETSVREAAKLMRERHTGDIVVADEFEGKRIPVGIVTDRDIVVEVLAEHLNPDQLSVGDIMTGTMVTARERDGIFETIALMRGDGVRRMPIVDASGALVGIVSLDDILELLAEELGDLVGLIRQERRKEIEARR
ncbi:MAG TPA: CBS domain-containing protein [Bryobacteraceae bacterium]|nr:CBS domain-containing protein [Bryobacteraceae bacterium]